LPDGKDTRRPAEKDRDRVLYSDYFSRLGGVTQVASASEGGVFHNRLTHSLKVAQVARRLAERLIRSEGISDIDADVVETAALAHDLGHPPFGHAGEVALCRAAEDFGLTDGFEGNAQTFRILTRLATSRQQGTFGLDLTRRTLAAVTKYPWLRDTNPESTSKARRKWGAYADDEEALQFAIGSNQTPEQTLEARIMDLADAITYSVHDLEDFYRAGLIPIERIARNRNYRRSFLKRWKVQSPDNASAIYADSGEGWEAISNLLDVVLTGDVEQGGQEEAELLEAFRSRAITAFVSAVSVKDGHLDFPDAYHHQVKFLQRLIWDYVILSPRLATQQAGQKRIVLNLATHFRAALTDRALDRLPTRFRKVAEELLASKENVKKPQLDRLVIDVVATLSESEAISFHRKIMGHDPGSVFDCMR
jgi:dGTPase